MNHGAGVRVWRVRVAKMSCGGWSTGLGKKSEIQLEGQ